ASVLLEKIAKEKSRLIKEGKFKKDKPLPEISEDEKPFELPEGWEWARAQEMMLSIADGDHLPPPKAPFGVPFLVIGNIRSGKIDYSESRFVTNEYFQLVDESRKPRRGDLLYTLVGSYGIPVIVDSDIEFCVQRHIGILKPSMNVNTRYLLYLYGSGFVFCQASKCATGIAQKTVPLSGLRKFIIPIPPLAEQNRIVAKVDELMAICDALKSRLNEAQTTQVQLADAIVEQAVA
ncbi:MAG TPA: type I restriction endonuclease subunit S, partial [Methanocellales archaeon]|nr:type I restriction endonuclease subunit S [Methanocellales archaeon]